MIRPPLSILVCALGGEGGGVLAEWLVDTATRCGHAAQATSIPGVAQRTGATTYYVEIAREPAREGEPAPVFSLYPVPGALDLLVASELLEAARQVALGFATRERTRVIASSERTLTTHEKMQMADGRADDEALTGVLRDWSAKLDRFAMTDAARRAGTAISSVMLGAIAGSHVLPFPRAAYEDAIRASGKGVEPSLAGFAAGHSHLQSGLHRDDAATHAVEPTVPALPPAIADRFPAAVHAMLAAGRARVIDYQDDAYADLYVDRVARIAAAERRADPGQLHGAAATRESARFLAGWMAFDDIVRVADLKCRASRLARVRAEVRAQEGEVLRVFDYFKPGVPELAALLPAALAERLLRWDRRRIASGREPFALALKLPTHSLAGLVALRFLASLKRARRRGSRFAAEQRLIERWLAAVEAGLARDWRVGHELALCARLVKGYGATSERGKDNLMHIVDHLASAPFASDDERAAGIRSARDAALADDAGRALDHALVAHGAPPRPVKAQPIVWTKKSAGRGADPRQAA